MSEIDEELFLMTNLYPASTGLPMVIWVGPSYGDQHDVWIKVMQAHGTRMDPHNLAVVALRPQPHVVAGKLSADDLRVVSRWIALNQAAIIDHWNGVTDGVQLGQQLRRLLPGGAHPQRPATRTTTLHTITWIKPFSGGGLNLTFDDKPEIESVDLSATLEQGGVFEPLRDQALFGTAEIGPNRRAVLWRISDRVIELSADDLWQMVHRSR